MKPVLARLGAVLLAASVVLSGCSSSGPTNEAEQFVVDYYKAGRAGDWETVCGSLDPEVVTALGGKAKCAEGLRKESKANGELDNLPADLEVSGSDMAADGNNGQVRVLDKNGREQVVKVVRIKGAWYITG
ncbi:hypothetical protein [Kribbia dieselivorans]|uniref:hypothetical protein n=1 Tax=Kribbia dieselivorans TaxID=331526 RepID=UPI00083865FA|nr:hypothetical protein [Kribbia dieselivorans]